MARSRDQIKAMKAKQNGSVDKIKKKKSLIEEFFGDTPDSRAKKEAQRFKARGRLSFG